MKNRKLYQLFVASVISATMMTSGVVSMQLILMTIHLQWQNRQLMQEKRFRM